LSILKEELMTVVREAPPSRYLDVDGVVVYDQELRDGSRAYSQFVSGRWEPYPLANIMAIINLGVEITAVQANEMMAAAELARTGCVFNGEPPDSDQPIGTG
jgi:hypothetical protein